MSRFIIGDLVVVKSGDPNRVFEVKEVVYITSTQVIAPSVLAVLYNIEEPKPNRMGGLISYVQIAGDHLEYANAQNPVADYNRAMRGI